MLQIKQFEEYKDDGVNLAKVVNFCDENGINYELLPPVEFKGDWMDKINLSVDIKKNILKLGA